MRARAGAGGPGRRREGVPNHLRLRTANDARCDLWQAASVRPRGHPPLLLAPPARGGTDQVEPAEDHRERHRLAIPERVEEGAEGVVDATNRSFVNRPRIRWAHAGHLAICEGTCERAIFMASRTGSASTPGLPRQLRAARHRMSVRRERLTARCTGRASIASAGVSEQRVAGRMRAFVVAVVVLLPQSVLAGGSSVAIAVGYSHWYARDTTA